MALSKDFEKWKGGCPWIIQKPAEIAANIPTLCISTGYTGCSLKNCAILYWLKHAFIDSNPGEVEF